MKPIQILINAKDNASAVFGSLQAKVLAVGSVIATYFGINAFVGVVKGAADLEQAMSRVQAATGATGEEMAALRKAAEDAGSNTKYTATEAAGALENLAKAGLSAKDAVATLPAVLSLAQAGDIGLAESSELVTKAVMGMGLAFTDAGRVADVLALGANATNTSVLGLAQALSYAAPVANSLGLSLESTVAIIGKFADAGIDASRAGTALNSILSQFGDPASKFRNELAAAGIVTGNFEDALHQLAAAGPRGSKAINAVGQEAGPALRALLNQGMGALDELTGKLKEAEGSAAATAKVMADNLNGSLTGLSSAWDMLKNALGTPVLPVLKDGVDQLAGALRSAVADGTITKFGEGIAAAFKAGITWAKEFLGTVDFAALVTRMQEFADEAGTVFTKVGEYASNAGNTVKLAYGVMSAGVNGVLTAIYGIGSVFTEMASVVMVGVAKLRDGLAAISFGSLSESFKLAAEDAREMARGFGEAAQAMRDKAEASLQDMAESAQTARDGFAGLSGALSDTGRESRTTSAAIASVAASLQDGAVAVAAFGIEQQKHIATQQAARQAANDHRATIAQLKDEYAALVASGSIQGAAEKLQELNKALQATGPAAKDAAKAAADAAAQIDAAFGRLGVTSSATLKDQATAAVRDYHLIKSAGTSTAQDIAAAFKVAAEKAIAANKGIAPSWVEAEASARGFKLEADAAGKTTVTSMNAAAASVEGVGTATRQAAGEFDYLGQRIEYTSERAKLLHQQGQILAASLEEQNQRTANSSIMNKGGTITGVDAVPSFESQEQADAWWEEKQRQYLRDNPFSTRSAGQLGNFGAAMTKFEFDREVDAMKLRNAMKGNGNASESSQTPLEAMRSAQVVTVNVNLNGQSYGTVSTDAAGAATLQQFVAELERARRATGR
ncbi:MAG: phage tail tape measure protein [Hyphomicrobiales bacterium]|nr:MAG: phage tail tape measure protein [Hyphomicrobiales bacterium]